MASAGADGAGPSNRALVPVEAEVDLQVHPSGIVPQLQNVVATVDLGCKLDLKEIALQARNAEYNPKVWGAAAAATVCRLPCAHLPFIRSANHAAAHQQVSSCKPTEWLLCSGIADHSCTIIATSIS
jgi:hypothetical protein